MFKNSRLVVWMAGLSALAMPVVCLAQDLEMDAAAAAAEASEKGGMGLWAIIAGSGWLGIVLWGA